MNPEEKRLQENDSSTAHWNRWGPYLSERQWGTVREDYSPGGTAWEFLPHDHARSQAYRWGEDGIAGICDRHGLLCFAVALWNRKDPVLKERLFGLTGNEGNHGEDVKECYWYLDNTPTHSYMRYLYKYPQNEFPYTQLVEENRRRGKDQPEFELVDTGIFNEGRYFDVQVEYAKAAPDDVRIRISVTNRGPDAAELDLLPTLWFRNTWTWKPGRVRPTIRKLRDSVLEIEAPKYGKRWFSGEGKPELLFTENETNVHRLYGVGEGGGHTKDSFHRYLIHGEKEAVNPEHVGSKIGARYALSIPPGGTAVVRLRLNDQDHPLTFGKRFDELFETRHAESDEFYKGITPGLNEERGHIQKMALSGLLWNKQFYHYDVQNWLDGDHGQPVPPASRLTGRNSDWKQVYTDEVLLMPDKWEYPWFAAWDMAFHSVALALVDLRFAKAQLELLTREWYMNPNGQLPAYEWAFGDVNPPVHAWAALRIYRIEKEKTGQGDRMFLERIFHKLLMNFTWWVNRKDKNGSNVFEGGFLGMDNIGVFDRSATLPTGGYIEQADGTAWMGMYSLNLFAIALELARDNRAYGATASKFFEHFLNIAHAMNHFGCDEVNLWNEEDGFYYDNLKLPDGTSIPLRVRSMVGLTALLAVESLTPDVLEKHPRFQTRASWFLDHRPEFCPYVLGFDATGVDGRRMLSIVGKEALRRLLERVLDEDAFLSPYGLRSISREHAAHPYVLRRDGREYCVDYEPGESNSGVFGGNSNWRGPIWFPLNFLLIDSLKKYHHYYGDHFQVECPSHSGHLMNLEEVAQELSNRLIRLFERGLNDRLPALGDRKLCQADPHWKDLLSFHEYFDGDTGAGLGASHQTGWTSMVALLIHECHGKRDGLGK